MARPRQEVMNMWAPPEKGEMYVIGADTSTGEDTGSGKLDDPVLEVARWIPPNRLVQVAEAYGPWDEEEFSDVIVRFATAYNEAFTCIEANTYGHVVNKRVFARYTNIYIRRVIDSIEHKIQRKLGYYTDRRSRPILIADLKLSVKHDRYYIVSKASHAEFCKFSRGADGTPRAAKGFHDDKVIAHGLVVQGAKYIGFVPELEREEEKRKEARDSLDPTSKRLWEQYDTRIIQNSNPIAGAGGKQRTWSIDDPRFNRFFEFGGDPGDVEAAMEEEMECRMMELELRHIA